MKKRYTFRLENWLRFALLTAFAASFSLNTSAQNGPAKMWDKTFGGNNWEAFQDLQQTTDRGFILGGFSGSGIGGDKSQANQGLRDYWIVKTDSIGKKLWDKTFGGNMNDDFGSLQQTSDGGYILGGSSKSDLSGNKTEACKGNEDFWLVKLDNSGNKIWDKTIGSSDPDELMCLQQTTDGGYIVGGRTIGLPNGDKSQAPQGGADYWIVKLDSSGNKMWDKVIGGSAHDFLRSVKQTSDGGYIIGGYSYSNISGDKSQASKGQLDFWVVKVDSLGNKLWDKTFGGTLSDAIYTIEQTSDGGYIIGGNSNSGISGDKSEANRGSEDYWVMKLNANGNKIWDKTFGGDNIETLYSLQEASDGGYIIGGSSGSGISGDKTQPNRGMFRDFWLIKIDTIGNIIWDKTLGGNNSDNCFALKQTSDGGIIAGGSSDSGISGEKTQASKGSEDFWIVKLGGHPLGIKETEASFNVSISPNPNQGKFTLQLGDLAAPNVEVTVSDLLGRVVLQRELQVSNQQISQELTLPKAKGLYLLRVQAGELLITRKVVVE